MTDFEAYQGPYKDWTKKRHERVMKTVVEIISRHVEYVVSRAVVADDFDWALPQNPNLTGHNAFSFCAIQCLQGIAAWADQQSVYEPIVYIFESGDRHGQDFENIRQKIEGSDYFKRRLRWNGLHVVSKIESAPPFPIIQLQSADVLSFEHRKEIENYYLPKIERCPRRWPLHTLLNQITETCFGRYKREQLLEIKIQGQPDHGGGDAVLRTSDGADASQTQGRGQGKETHHEWTTCLK